MSGFNISSNLNSNKVFIFQRDVIESRFDPFFYIPEALELERRILSKNPKRLRDYVLAISSGQTPKRDEEEKYYSDKEKGITAAK